MNDARADGAMDPPAQETADRERGPNTRDRASRTSTAAGSPASAANRQDAGRRVGTDAGKDRRACAPEVTVQRVPVGGIRLFIFSVRPVASPGREVIVHEPARRGSAHHAGRLVDRRRPLGGLRLLHEKPRPARLQKEENVRFGTAAVQEAALRSRERFERIPAVSFLNDDRAMGPSDRGGRPGCRRAAARWTRGLRARGRTRVWAAGLRSSLVGRLDAVGSSAAGEPRLFFAWDPRNTSRARSVALHGLCVVGLDLTANANPYEQHEPARRNEKDRGSRGVGGHRRKCVRGTRLEDAACGDLRSGPKPSAREGRPALEGQDPPGPSTLAALRERQQRCLEAEGSGSQDSRRERGALTRWFQGSRRGTGRVCEPDDASRADRHDETGRITQADGRGFERLLRRAERRTKRARRLTAPGWFPTFCVGVCTPTARRTRRS